MCTNTNVLTMPAPRQTSCHSVLSVDASTCIGFSLHILLAVHLYVVFRFHTLVDVHPRAVFRFHTLQAEVLYLAFCLQMFRIPHLRR